MLRYLTAGETHGKCLTLIIEGMPAGVKIDIDEIKDYMQLIPYDLPEQFTAKEYAKEAKLTPRKASSALNILSYLNIIKKIGKRGRAYLYKIIEI